MYALIVSIIKRLIKSIILLSRGLLKRDRWCDIYGYINHESLSVRIHRIKNELTQSIKNEPLKNYNRSVEQSKKNYESTKIKAWLIIARNAI